MAFPHMRPGQRASCVPGVRAITLKKDFVLSWQRAFGELAFGYIPRSYALPEQYWIWRSHLLRVRDGAALPTPEKGGVLIPSEVGRRAARLENRRANVP